MAREGKEDTEIAIRELRRSVKDLDGVECGCDYLQDDLYLLRILKARWMNVKKGEKLYRENVQWRKDKRVKEWGSFHSGLSKEFPVRKSIMKNGMPVTTLHAGLPDIKGLIEKYGKDTFYQYVFAWILDAERGSLGFSRKSLEKQGEGRETITENSHQGQAVFIDLKDLAWRQIMCLKNVSLAIQLASDFSQYFPGVLSLLVCINCPNSALKVVNLLKKIIETPEFSIEVYGSDKEVWQKALLQRVHAHELPTNFGGSLSAPEFMLSCK